MKFKHVYKLYDSANIVATLWMISAILPIMVFPIDGKPNVINIIGILVFGLLGFSLTQYRKIRIEEMNWNISDTLAYLLVPGFLFVGVMLMYGYNYN